MSFSDCARCWDTPCTCDGGAVAFARVLRDFGFKVQDATDDHEGERERLARVLEAAGLRKGKAT